MSVLVRVEAVHEDQGHVGVVLLVEVLYLLNRQVQECQIRPHGNHRLRTTENMFEVKIFFYRTYYYSSPATHGGAQTSIEFDHHQLVQHRTQRLLVSRLGQAGVRQYLKTRRSLGNDQTTLSLNSPRLDEVARSCPR